MKTKKRIYIIDEIRGFLIIAVVICHALYSLDVIFNAAPFIGAYNSMLSWQPIIPGLFILISGISFQLSRNNVKRGLKLLAVAALITAATAIVLPSEAIWFGIIHFLAVVNIIFGLLRKYVDKIPAISGIIILAFLFVLTYNVHRGYLGIEGILSLRLPTFLYQTDLTAPLGFYTNSFRSADYSPLIPWTFLFLIGTISGRYTKYIPESLAKMHIRPLAFIGRHTLIIYLVHQPIIVGVLYIIEGKI